MIRDRRIGVLTLAQTELLEGLGKEEKQFDRDLDISGRNAGVNNKDNLFSF